MTPRRWAAAVGIVVAAIFTGCGDQARDARRLDRAAETRAALASIAEAPATHRVTVSARQGSYAFEQRAVRAAAGRVSITLRNPTGVWHDVMVLDDTRPGPKRWPYLGHQPILPATGANRLATDTTVVDLAPGRYRLICNILGHAESGMTIPLEVVDAPDGAAEAPLPDTARQAVDRLPATRVRMVRASPAPAWSTDEVSVPAGRVGFELVNRSSVPTNLIVLSPDGRIQTPDAPVIGRGRAGFAIELAPGEYQLTNLADGARMTVPLHVR